MSAPNATSSWFCRILGAGEKDHGIEPAPERGAKTPWKTFLAAHWDGLAAADFFIVEVLTMGGLVRYVVFFVPTVPHERVVRWLRTWGTPRYRRWQDQ